MVAASNRHRLELTRAGTGAINVEVFCLKLSSAVMYLKNPPSVDAEV